MTSFHLRLDLWISSVLFSSSFELEFLPLCHFPPCKLPMYTRNNNIHRRCSRLLCIFARDKTQKLARTLVMYQLVQRRGLNWGRSNRILGFPLHLPQPTLSFPGSSVLHKKITHIIFGTDRVYEYIRNKTSEIVEHFNYLGTSLINQNSIHQ